MDQRGFTRSTSYNNLFGSILKGIAEVDKEIDNFGELELWEVTIKLEEKVGSLDLLIDYLITLPYMDTEELDFYLKHKFKNIKKYSAKLIRLGKLTKL